MKNRKQAEEFSNRFAPEHLEILAKDARNWLPDLRHAGAIFIGPSTAEAFGDYTAGTNHVLPTGGTARFSSEPIGIRLFEANQHVGNEKPGLKALGKATVDFAEEEGLGAHAQSVMFRLGK